MNRNFMLRAYRLAVRGVGLASPNPMVGAVVVRGGRLVGQGTHTYKSVKHAERIALEEAGGLARGADLYVTLEPCSHQGRTPPCAQAVVEYGIKRVFCGMIDPNPQVSGRGLEYLRKNGIEVFLWDDPEPFRQLNRAFIKYISQKKPWVVLKAAMTLDSKMAPSDRKRIQVTGEKAIQYSHFLRYKCDAILVGARTVIVDDPLLTCRYKKKKDTPLKRVVLDGALNIPIKSRVVKSAPEVPLLIYTSEICDASKKTALERAGAEVVVLGKEGKISLNRCLEDLARKQISSVLIEGGAEVLAQFFSEELGDEFYFFYAPKVWGGEGVSFFDMINKTIKRHPFIRGVKMLGEDLLVYGAFRHRFI